MKPQLRISAKTLGELALPDFCPRCFWVKQHAGKLPFQIFPGIFSSIDSYTKKIIHCHFDEGKCSPEWLSELGELTGYINPPHYTKFQITDTASDVILWGTPDGIYKTTDGVHIIVDYKTAKYTGAQDHLMPVYSVQLNAYAVIGEQCGLHPVTRLALIYMEPVTDGKETFFMSNQRQYGFDMGFAATIHGVNLEPGLIPTLLAQAKEIYELEQPPRGRTACKECANLENLIAIIHRKEI
jgi:hypothetical protein